MAVRTSLLAEIKVLSLASLAAWSLENSSKLSEVNHQGSKKPASPAEALEIMRAGGSGSNWQNPISSPALSKLFRTVGMATSLQIDENFGTQNVYSIGAPTRPKTIAGNYQANVTMEKIQLDRRNTFSYVTSPDYWYSVNTQRGLAVNSEWALYTYLTVYDRETSTKNLADQEVFCLMPQSARSGITTQDTMITHNVSMIGFKYRYEDMLGLLLSSKDSILDYGRTVHGQGNAYFGDTFKTKRGGI